MKLDLLLLPGRNLNKNICVCFSFSVSVPEEHPDVLESVPR